jgi:hypothetical protein
MDGSIRALYIIHAPDNSLMAVVRLASWRRDIFHESQRDAAAAAKMDRPKIGRQETAARIGERVSQ